MEGLLGDVVEHRLGVAERAALEPFVPGQHLGLGGLKDAVEAAQDGERQDDLAVLGRLVGARSRSATLQMKLTLSPKPFTMARRLDRQTFPLPRSMLSILSVADGRL